ncbi:MULTISPECIES: hypothetical protein [unclassified Actinoplanes]|uniref:hypothetical protein n=1 Tax=unclassified Actinoplanes TaxID=2626549 RepID=UPI0005BD68C9|nr:MULTISPECIES: hypothetical protein [unclassified Actinoplanes]
MTATDLPRSGPHDVDWAKLDRGTVVRTLLTDLTTDDPATRAAARRALCRNAPDGEDVRPWVTAALPTLLALVADPAQPERGPLLHLIADLAGADRTWQMSGETLRAKRLLAAHAAQSIPTSSAAAPATQAGPSAPTTLAADADRAASSTAVIPATQLALPRQTEHVGSSGNVRRVRPSGAALPSSDSHRRPRTNSANPIPGARQPESATAAEAVSPTGAPPASALAATPEATRGPAARAATEATPEAAARAATQAPPGAAARATTQAPPGAAARATTKAPLGSAAGTSAETPAEPAPGFLAALMADEDPLVRDAAAYLVRAVARLLPGLIELIWGRYVEEPDPAVRVTLVRSGVVAGAVGSGVEPTKVWLAWAADSDADLRVRITALTELMALLNPPPFDVETARETVLAAYKAGLNREPAPLDDAVAPLLAGRRMAARQWTPGYPQVVSVVRTSYRNDVRPQLDLLTRMLELDAADARQDALHEARALVRRLRAPYRPLVVRAAELLGDDDPQVRAAALRMLHGVGELARPAADDIWATLPPTRQRIRPGQSPWVQADLTLGPAVRTLAGLRDERVLPMLERLLDELPGTVDLHRFIAGYGARARGLSRTLRRLLRAVEPSASAQRLSFLHPETVELPRIAQRARPSSIAQRAAGLFGDDALRAALLRALIAVAPHEAADHLTYDPIDLTTLDLLARAGRSAAARIPEIRLALTCGDPALELAAAQAIWRVAGDAEAAASVYDRYFDDPATLPEHAVTALDGLRDLRLRVKSRTRRLVSLAKTRRNGAVVVAAADALWWIAGNQDAARTLGPVWESLPRARPRIARIWTDTGDARYAARYVKAELATTLRHNATLFGRPTTDINEDEHLLALCRDLLAKAS